MAGDDREALLRSREDGSWERVVLSMEMRWIRRKCTDPFNVCRAVRPASQDGGSLTSVRVTDERATWGQSGLLRAVVDVPPSCCDDVA